MALKFSELQKAKEVAERKEKEATAAVESLTAELQKEKHMNTSAVHLAKKASSENAAIKRAIESLGCQVHFSSSSDCNLDIEKYPLLNLPRSTKQSLTKDVFDVDEKSDLSVSIAAVADDILTDTSDVSRACETLCPFQPRDGGCRWPDAGCAQFGSQFVGLTANFDAFDRLPIYDSSFDPEKM